MAFEQLGSTDFILQNINVFKYRLIYYRDINSEYKIYLRYDFISKR